jgi:hypothetical protein
MQPLRALSSETIIPITLIIISLSSTSLRKRSEMRKDKFTHGALERWDN